MPDLEFDNILPMNLHGSSNSQKGSRLPNELWELILMLGFGDLSITEGLYHNLRSKLSENDWRRPLMEIGESRFHCIAGKEVECLKNLTSASDILFSPDQSLAEGTVSEIMALYYYVITILWEKVRDIPDLLQMLYSGWNSTSIPNFKLAFEYRIASIRVSSHNLPLSQLALLVAKLEERKLWALVCIGYRRLAIAYRDNGDYAKSHENLKLGLKVALEHNLETNIMQISMTRGTVFYKQGKIDQAKNTFSKIYPSNSENPAIPLLLEHLALIAEQQGDIKQAFQHITSALKFSTKLDMISLVPSEYLYLGQTCENYYKDLEQAEHYYKQGYDHAMRYASHGVNLTGDRKDVVDAYVNLINKKRGKTAPVKAARPADSFAFSQGKPWKDVKDIFHHQLICFHLEHEPNSKSLAKKLDMPPSTLYSVQNRLKKRGYLLPEKTSPPTTENHALFNFIEEHEEMSWEEINAIFEREIIHYLYEKYGYNKQRMAQILELSYPSIITKTRELTQVNDHLLPN